MLNTISQTERDKHHMFCPSHGLEGKEIKQTHRKGLLERRQGVKGKGKEKIREDNGGGYDHKSCKYMKMPQ